jgi:hypothetical protein
MKLLLGDDVDRAAIGPRGRTMNALRASNGAGRRVPVLLQALPGSTTSEGEASRVVSETTGRFFVETAL